jgi:hypothetical protein
VIPEAWEFIPEGKGSPVKNSAVTLVRKGAAIGNLIWVDSQDMAGVDKTILRGCTVWLIGVQREANEIKRNLSNIPAGISRPSAADVATLGRGEFFACWHRIVRRVYVQPVWMQAGPARDIARGDVRIEEVLAHRALLRASDPRIPTKIKEDEVNKQEADALRAENAQLRREIEKLQKQVAANKPGALPPAVFSSQPRVESHSVPITPSDMDTIYIEVRRRAMFDTGILQILSDKPEINVKITKVKIEIDGTTLKGRIARLLADGFYDDGQTNSATRTELKRLGPDANNANIGRTLADLQRDGFLTLEAGDRFKAVPGMKVNVIEV